MNVRGRASCAILLLSLAARGAVAQTTTSREVSLFATAPAETLAWDARLAAMEAAEMLQRVADEVDPLAPGWRHQRYQQYHRGLPVFGAQLVRHLKDGRPESVNGVFYEDLALETIPGIGPGQAGLAAERAAGAPNAFAVGELELLVYHAGGRPVLAYRVPVRTEGDLLLFFIDAHDGSLVDGWSDLRQDAPVVGRGIGTWSDQKKVSATERESAFFAQDGLRPAVLLTVDVAGRFDAWNRYAIDPRRSAARDGDNDWRDGAVVDAHVYAGWAYDYFYKRFGRRGLDDRNATVTSYVHFWPPELGPHPILNNAFWDPTDRSVNYGDGDGVTFHSFASALEVVVHELSHGITQFTSELVYRNESGALDEAFSDIMGIGAEFFYEPRGFGRQRSDWAVGEDLFIRSFQDDRFFVIRFPPRPGAIDDPDHYRNRYRGPDDRGGVHINASIVTHAFYLFVEGGRNATSGVRVGGIGFGNLERAEKIFHRAFTSYLTPTSDFATARRATLRSAVDLYGADSREVRELTRAWDAVGVP